MRTNIELNEDLVAEAQRLTGLRTKRGLIDHALRELVRRRQQRRLLELRGRVKWEGNLSKIRQGRFKA
jgi:Arc/MetJ family transcription regulator